MESHSQEGQRIADGEWKVNMKLEEGKKGGRGS